VKAQMMKTSKKYNPIHRLIFRNFIIPYLKLSGLLGKRMPVIYPDIRMNPPVFQYTPSVPNAGG
jgi:hypothetical protein